MYPTCTSILMDVMQCELVAVGFPLLNVSLMQVSQSGMVCSVCYRGRASVKDKPEPLLQCSHCHGNSKISVSFILFLHTV